MGPTFPPDSALAWNALYWWQPLSLPLKVNGEMFFFGRRSPAKLHTLPFLLSLSSPSLAHPYHLQVEDSIEAITSPLIEDILPFPTLLCMFRNLQIRISAACEARPKQRCWPSEWCELEGRFLLTRVAPVSPRLPFIIELSSSQKTD